MIAQNDHLLCKQAKDFYYNYLRNDSKDEIPVELIEHMDLCPYCESNMDELQIQLTAIEQNTDVESERDAIILENLELHCNYINKPVSCNAVKPFLSNLADHALAVHVPTPITIHIDNCRQCGENLKAIGNLGLTHKQLCILGQVYAQKMGSNHETCSKALAYLEGVSTMDFEGIPAEVLRHFCVCPDCRKALFNRRSELINDIEWNEEGFHISYEEVKAADLFDYVIPYGIDPANDQYAKFRKSLTSHLTNCKECLTKMNELHSQVYSILECKESNVVTIFKADESGQEDVNLPIAVEVLDKEKDKIPSESDSLNINTESIAQAEKAPWRFKPIFKPMAVAATILLIVLLTFKGSVLQAVDLNQIYKALAKVKNIHIVKYDSETSEPIIKIWISQLLNVKMFKTPIEYGLWDINSKELKTNEIATNPIKTKEIDSKAIADVESTMHTPWDLLPFTSIADVPGDVVWQQVEDKGIISINPNIDVYDLSWSMKKMDGVLFYHKRRIFVNTKTHLPQKIECWERHIKENEYEFTTSFEIDYPTNNQIQQVIEQAGF